MEQSVEVAMTTVHNCMQCTVDIKKKQKESSTMNIAITGFYLHLKKMKNATNFRKMWLYVANKEISKLNAKLEEILKKSGITVNTDLHDELLDIMGENNRYQKCPSDSFRRLFWEEQLKAARANDARQMRWHPMIISWYLNLKLLSSSAYHSLCTAGFIKLPSERTLRDYTNFLLIQSWVSIWSWHHAIKGSSIGQTT